MARAKPQQPSAAGRSAVHGIRVVDPVWAAAKRRATADDVTLNYATSLLLEGYAKGLIDLPRIVKQYKPSRSE